MLQTVLPVADKCRHQEVHGKSPAHLENAIRRQFPAHPAQSCGKHVTEYDGSECQTKTEEIVRNPFEVREGEKCEGEIRGRRRTALDEHAKQGGFVPFE